MFDIKIPVDKRESIFQYVKCVGISSLINSKETLRCICDNGKNLTIDFQSEKIKNIRLLRCDFLEFKQDNVQYVNLDGIIAKA